MNYRNRIQRLEESAPDNTLEGWELHIVIGGNEPCTYALNTTTGKRSQDPDLLERLRIEGREKGGTIKFNIVGSQGRPH